MRKITAVIFCFLLSAYSFSQVYNINKIGKEKGLSDNNILTIAEDKNGFIWFGTDWGLNRFDGYSIKTYKVDPDNENTISDNGINKILVDDKKNILWIGTKSGGLNTYDCLNQKFTHYPTSSDKKNSTKSEAITDLCFSNDDAIWIATYQNGLKKLDLKNDSIIHYNDLNIPQLNNYRIKCIVDDKKGNLYIGHWGEGFSIFSEKTRSLKFFCYDPKKTDGLPDNDIMDIYLDSRGNIWLGTHKGLALYNPKTDTFDVARHDAFNQQSIADRDINSIEEINGELWIGTWKGGINIMNLDQLDRVSLKDAYFRHIPFNDLPTGLSSSSVSCFFRDSFKNIWIGAYGSGINVIPHRHEFFKKISYSPLKDEENGLSNKIVTSISYDKQGQLWIATKNGNIDIYKDEKKIKSYGQGLNFISGNDILCSLTDSKGNIWLGLDRNGLICFNEQKKTFEKIKITNNDITHTYITCIYEDKDANIWAGSNDGVIKYNPISGKVEELNINSISLQDGLIRCISEDVNGNIWIGNWLNGISIITKEFDLIKSFTPWSGFISNNMSFIYKDSSDRMWVCCTNGLVLFPSVSTNDYSYKVLNQKNGIPDNYIKAVIEGKPGEIWMTTNAGISKYSVEDDKIINYDYHDGLPRASFVSAAVLRNDDGIIYFGSEDGICYFNVNNDSKKEEVPPIVITRFSLYNNQEIQSNNTIDIPVNFKIELKYRENTFTIDFNIMDYALQSQIEYSYRLIGIDELWYQTNGRNQVTFRNISPGKYTFQVKSRIRNQEWSENITSLDIVIDPPFWLSWWAKIIYSLIIILIIISIIKFYKRRLALENQLYLEKQNNLQEQNLNLEKLQFYTNVAHELRTPITLILGPLGDLIEDKSLESSQTKKVSIIHKSALHLYGLVNQILEFRKTETHNRVLNIMYGDIFVTIQEVTLKYKELNQNRNISIQLFNETESPIYYDPEVIGIILDNIISNALKYTEKGTVVIKLREREIADVTYTEIEVSDTGCGIFPDALNKIFDRYYQAKGEKQAFGTGIGLALVKNLITLHNGIIDVKSKIGEGTSFFIRLQKDNTYPDALHIQKEENENNFQIKKDSIPLLLIVEDNDEVLEYITSCFKESYEVITAKNGDEGVKIAKDRIPDIIISDIMMPVMDGITLCKILKEDIYTSHIPIILLTAKDTEQDKTEGYYIGADSYITKPFNANMLRTRVLNLLTAREKIAKYLSTNTYKKVISSNALNELDNEFVKKTVSIIQDNMDSNQISVAFLAEQLHMSYSTFSRKIKALTGITVYDLIKRIKMQYAEQLLLMRKYTISEIAFQVGYNSMAHFREAFKSEYGVSPSSYIKNLDSEE